MSTAKFESPMNLVSIICRTVGRPELKQALESALNQSYSAIEIILVNASKADLSGVDVDQERIIVLNPGSILSRAEAANSGLDAASGDYLMFLDDDDWISSNHVHDLLTALRTNSNVQATYSSAQKTNHEGLLLEHIFETEYDPYLLMRDNYIPIHTVLFEKSLITQGCRFDNTFEIYEDWDFWLQLSQHTDFKHVPNITAFYRTGGNSGTDIRDQTIRFNPTSKIGKARASIYEKWKNNWSGNQINLLVGTSLRANLSKNLLKVENRFSEELKKTAKLNEKIKDLEASNFKIKERLDHASEIIAGKERYINKLANRIKELESKLAKEIEHEKHLRLHVNELEQAYTSVLNSKTWRLVAPLRRIGRFFKIPGEKIQPANEIKPKAEEKSSDTNGQKELGLTLEHKPRANSRKIKDAKASYSDIAREKLSSLMHSDGQLIFPQIENPQLSIVVVFYNQPHLGLLCLESLLLKADVEYELIIVDNASDEKTNLLLDRIRNVKIIRNKQNLGFVRAVNQAAELAYGKYILLLNNDALIEERALSKALECMNDTDSVGAVGGKIKLTDGTLQEAGSIIWADGSCQGYGRGESPSAPAYMFKREVDYCSGAFLLFRKNQFEKLGGFDQDYSPAYYEETDFCIRLQKQGLKIIYNPEVQLTHYEFGSSEGLEAASLLQKKHRQILQKKHEDWLAKKRQPDLNNILDARTSNTFHNVLFIDDRVPHPSLGSGYPRSAHLLNTLAEFDLNITLYPLQFPVDDWDDSYKTLNKKIEIILNEGRAGLHRFLKERRSFFKHIIISRVHNMKFFRSIIEKEEELIADENIIYDAEALTSNREIMKMELQDQPPTELEKSELIQRELDHACIANSVIAVSQQEATVYQERGIKNVHVLGHTIKPNPGANTFHEREGLLFVGALRDEGSPNVDSLLWFVVNVLPLIEAQIPSINLYVVGDLRAESLFTINKKNVVFKGRLETIDEMYNHCRVFIAPTRFAAGIPHKVHEAASAGIPSVTTKLLSQQLLWDDEKEVLVGTDALTFARQCVRLYEESNTWGRIREGGLKAVTTDCSNSIFKKTLKSIVS